MEVSSVETIDGAAPGSTKKTDSADLGDIEIISNWNIINDRLLQHTISTVDVVGSSERAKLEDVVSLETCIRLEGGATEKREPCNIDIKLKNGQKIARIAIVSEAFLIELYKQFGEYASTAHAEFIDEFEQSAVYFADARLNPPTPEVSIKFARLKNPGSAMWLYGIRLSLTQPAPREETEHIYYNMIGELLQGKSRVMEKPAEGGKKLSEKCETTDAHPNPDIELLNDNFTNIDIRSSTNVEQCGKPGYCRASQNRSMECMGDTVDISDSELKNYIDHKFREMEERLNQRIQIESCKTNEKLDNVLKLLSNKSN